MKKKGITRNSKKRQASDGSLEMIAATVQAVVGLERAGAYFELCIW